MKTMIAALAACATTCIAKADVVAYWAFPEAAQTPNYDIAWPIAASLGSGSLDADAPKYDGSPTPSVLQQGSMQFFAGSTVNAQPGFDAGQGLSTRSDTQNRAQGKGVILTLDTTNYADLVLSFAERYSSTGPIDVRIDYSTDGVTFFSWLSYATTRDGAFGAAPRVINLSAIDDIEGLGWVQIKIGFFHFTPGGNGAARLDNITIEGTFVPAPGSLALLGLGGLASLRPARRRRAR
ncbi:MAG: hypothetical protein RBS39_07775 [Phycisphaerales bacterium]|nr:hypothetical protein [Phycisphaerales bacterium]